MIVQANSGLPFNIRSNRRSEQGRREQRSADRRRAQRRPARHGAQPRPALLAVHPASRTAQRGELFLEAKNLFNTENIAGVNRVVTTDAPAIPPTPIPIDGDDYPTAERPATISGMLQLGLQVHVLTARCAGSHGWVSGKSPRARIVPAPGLQLSDATIAPLPFAALRLLLIARCRSVRAAARRARRRAARTTSRSELTLRQLRVDRHASWRPTRIPTTRTTRCWRC